jgi:uncharacterized protein (TIGR02147 family)
MDEGTPTAPEIYRYYDYHAYLRDYCDWRKVVNGYFSLRYIGGKVGLDAGLVVRILQGKRPISLKKIPVFVSLLGLSNRRAEYFELLVLYGRAKSDKEAKQYFERLLSFTTLGGKRVERQKYEFYQEWYYTAIREILSFYPLIDNYDALAAMMVPTITTKDAKKAIELLENLGMIIRKRGGGFELTEKYLTTGDEWRSFAIQRFQQKSIDLASHALESIPKAVRDISTVTLTINRDSMDKIRERVRQFHKEMLEISEQGGLGDQVYQVNLQVFPLTIPYTGKIP